jgi:hypothetical protein
MTAWTVYVESDIEANETDIGRIGNLLQDEAPGSVMAPGPRLGCRFELGDEPLPPRALAAAQSLFLVAVRRVLAVDDGDVSIVRVEMAQGAATGWVPRGLITQRGLAERFGKSPAWVRTCLKFEGEGKPRPVEVEGGTEAVFDTELAVAYLSKVFKT